MGQGVTTLLSAGIAKSCLTSNFATNVAVAIPMPSVSPATNGGFAGVPQTFWIGWPWAGDVVGVGQSGYHLATGQFSAMDLLGFAPSVGWAMGAYRGVRGFSWGVVAPNSGASQLAEQIAGLGQRLAGQIDTIARMRPFADRLKDVAANPSKWKVVRSVSEASTNIRNRGGRSLQELLRNDETGETIVRHTLFKPNGTEFEPPHFRELWK